MKSKVFHFNSTDMTTASIEQGPLQKGHTRLHLVFGPRNLANHQEFIKFIGSIPPHESVLGCSTAGEISGRDVLNDSIVVASLDFSRTKLKVASVAIESPQDSVRAGRDLALQLQDPSLKGVIVLSDGLLVNGTGLIEGLNSVFEGKVTVTGGLAADGSLFKSTWVLVDRVPRDGCVTAVGLYGPAVRLQHGTQGGWDIFGPERSITKSIGNVLYEIDGQPALQLYKKYLGAKTKDLPASGLLFPIQIWRSGNDANPVVRTILGIDESAQSITFAGDMPEGWSAQLMRANFDRLIDGASTAAGMVESINAGFSLAISCVGRKLLLGERIDEEVDAVMKRLPEGTLQAGFYSYGEISPLVSGQACHLHNQTMTLTYITEDDRQDVA